MLNALNVCSPKNKKARIVKRKKNEDDHVPSTLRSALAFPPYRVAWGSAMLSAQANSPSSVGTSLHFLFISCDARWRLSL
jgi:hypothetical protein